MTPDAGARWSHERQSRAALAAAIAMMFIWGVNFGVTKYVLGALGVGPFLFIRFTAASLLGFLLLAIVYRHHLPKSWPRRADLPRFAICGVIGHTLHVGIVTWGINLSTAFSSALVLTSGPLWTLLILSILGVEKAARAPADRIGGRVPRHRRVPVRQVRGRFFDGRSRRPRAAVRRVAVFPLHGDLEAARGALRAAAAPRLHAAVRRTAASAADVAFVPRCAARRDLRQGLARHVLVCGHLRFLGWLVWTWVNAVRGVARSAPLQYLMPPIAGVVAWFTLGETFSALKIAGAAVTMAGVAWAQFGGVGPPPREAAQPDSG
jgi:drug/metabolite transporter (DMT)-like permease